MHQSCWNNCLRDSRAEAKCSLGWLDSNDKCNNNENDERKSKILQSLLYVANTSP